MLLSQQIFSFLYHFLAGSLFAFFFSFVSLVILHASFSLRLIVLFVFTSCFMLLFYSGLYMINGGVTHFYAIIIFFVGCQLYYMTFFSSVLPFFIFLKEKLKFFQKLSEFAKIKLYAIISMEKGKKRRSLNWAKRRKNKQIKYGTTPKV